MTGSCRNVTFRWGFRYVDPAPVPLPVAPEVGRRVLPPPPGSSPQPLGRSGGPTCGASLTLLGVKPFGVLVSTGTRRAGCISPTRTRQLTSQASGEVCQVEAPCWAPPPGRCSAHQRLCRHPGPLGPPRREGVCRPGG